MPYRPAGASDTAPSFARCRSPCTPAARSCRTQNVAERQPLAWQRASPFFCQQILQRRIVEHGVRQELFQPGILALKPLQPPGLRDLKPAVLGLPVVEARLADPVFAAQIGRLNPGLVLLQDRNDLLFRMPFALHRLALSQGQTPVHPGSIQRGNVNGSTESYAPGEASPDAYIEPKQNSIKRRCTSGRTNQSG